MSDDLTGFLRLIEAIGPWRTDIVVVGGWAHRMYRNHPSSTTPLYAAIRTRDADLAFADRVQLEGDLAAALRAAGFREELSSEETPPLAQYVLGEDDRGFHAEFLTPLRGSGTKRDGSADATVAMGGVIAQKLRHVDLLLIDPWQITIEVDNAESAVVLIANPVAFLVQKLLIHARRPPAKLAQDVVYIHDTIELFGGSLDMLHGVWQEGLSRAVSKQLRAAIEAAPGQLFDQTTDVIREAARIPADRELSPDQVRYVCREGLRTILEG